MNTISRPRKIILLCAILALIAGAYLLLSSNMQFSDPFAILGGILLGFAIYVLLSALIEHTPALRRAANRYTGKGDRRRE